MGVFCFCTLQKLEIYILFVVLSPAWVYFAHMETSSLPVKGSKIKDLSSALTALEKGGVLIVLCTLLRSNILMLLVRVKLNQAGKYCFNIYSKHVYYLSNWERFDLTQYDVELIDFCFVLQYFGFFCLFTSCTCMEGLVPLWHVANIYLSVGPDYRTQEFPGPPAPIHSDHS